MIELRPLSLEDALAVLPWRRQFRETLRTTLMKTEEEQTKWYHTEVANPESRTCYWGLWETGTRDLYTETRDLYVGYGGVENIHWQNSNGEISLLIRPECHGMGYGRQAVMLFLEEAFLRMGLHSVNGECYRCGPVGFWQRLVSEGHYKDSTWLSARKHYEGAYHPSYYFTLFREDYEAMRDPRESRQPADTAQEH